MSVRQAFRSETWISDLGLEVRRFGDLHVPGTHNSAIGDVDASDPLQSSLRRYRWLLYFPFVSMVIAAWTQCQSLGVREQLDAGVRYLDIRVAVKDGTVYVAHTMRGRPLHAVLDEVASFYDQNGTDNEVCVIHIKRDAENDELFRDQESARKLVRDTIADHRVSEILTRVERPFEKSLRAVANPQPAARPRSTPVILLMEDMLYADDGPGYRAPRYQNKWFNTNNPDELRTHVSERLLLADVHTPATLSVLQNILTPTASAIVSAVVMYVGVSLVVLALLGVFVAMPVLGLMPMVRHPATWVCVFVPLAVVLIVQAMYRPSWTLRSASRPAKRDFLRDVIEKKEHAFNVVTVDDIDREFAHSVIEANV